MRSNGTPSSKQRQTATAASPRSSGSYATDDSRSSMEGSRRDRRSKRNRRGKGGGARLRQGLEMKHIMTPTVGVLLFGLLLALADVLYIMKHLEQKSEELSNPGDTAPVSPSLSMLPPRTDGKGGKPNGKPNKFGLPNKHSSGKPNGKPNKHGSELRQMLADREPIIKLIRDAGISFDPVADAELIEELPTWADVVEMYGPEPVIYGINEGNCKRFQGQTDPGDHFLGTAGTFNTGTNFMSELLIQNCLMPERMKKHGPKARGIRWQVPWGKHSPAGDRDFREKHKTVKDKDVDGNEIMPVVTIRDPLVWMKSMCRHKYTARWFGFLDPNCPNFSLGDLTTSVKYAEFTLEYDSLIDLWNKYYLEYKNIDIPFLLVRFEDLVFHAEEVTRKVCECAGGKIYRKNFRYVLDSAKKGKAAHGAMSERTGYVDALVRYGTLAKRYKGWNSRADLEYIREHIDPTIMGMMQYAEIDPNWVGGKNPHEKTGVQADPENNDDANDNEEEENGKDDDARENKEGGESNDDKDQDDKEGGKEDDNDDEVR